jgi:transposase
MAYRIAGIDVHKKMLAVVVADVEVGGEYHFERQRFGSNPEELRRLSAWLSQLEVEEVVMESTAQYWQPVWGALERYWKAVCQKRQGAGPLSGSLHLAQAQSNRGARGRKKDFPEAERLVRRLVAQELTLSFVPDAEQRLWRTVMRRKYQLTRNRVQLQNRLESLLEEAHVKLSSLVSDLLGISARRMLQAIAEGETNPAALAALADYRLRATEAQLCDALGACTELNSVYRRLLKMALQELQLIEQQMQELEQEMASLLRQHEDAVRRLAECQAWAWIRHSKSLPRSGLGQPPLLPPRTWPLGWVPVRETRRARGFPTVIAHPKAIVTCGAFSTKPPMLPSG